MIGKEFNELRASNRSLAYRTKQVRIHEYFGILSEIISPKDLLDEARKCEEYMGSDPGSQGGNALDELAEFLNGKSSEKRVN